MTTLAVVSSEAIPPKTTNRTTMASFKLFITRTGGLTAKRKVNYPMGTSPREIALHQLARHPDYQWVSVSRNYPNAFGNAPYSFSRLS